MSQRQVQPLQAFWPTDPATCWMCGQVGRRWAHPAVRAFHVTSSRNRESVRLVGLDWERMAASPGIAGSLGRSGCRFRLSTVFSYWASRSVGLRA